MTDITLQPGQVWYSPRGTMAIVVHEIDGDRIAVTHHIAGPFDPVTTWESAETVGRVIADYQMRQDVP